MTHKHSKNVYTFAKTFAGGLLIYSLYPLLTIILYLSFYDYVLEVIKANNLQITPSSEIIATNTISFVYCIIGGIGLLKLKRWAMFFVTIIGIYVFGMSIIEFAVILSFGSFEFPIIKTILGVSSLYVLKNRALFHK